MKFQFQVVQNETKVNPHGKCGESIVMAAVTGDNENRSFTKLDPPSANLSVFVTKSEEFDKIKVGDVFTFELKSSNVNEQKEEKSPLKPEPPNK